MDESQRVVDTHRRKLVLLLSLLACVYQLLSDSHKYSELSSFSISSSILCSLHMLCGKRMRERNKTKTKKEISKGRREVIWMQSSKYNKEVIGV